MAYITNDAQLQKLLMDALDAAIYNVAVEITDELQASIMDNIYSGSESEYYLRTYEFLTAYHLPSTLKSGNSITSKIGMDDSKIHPQKRDVGVFNSHMSFNGEGVAQDLVEWWDTGTSSSPIHNIPKTNYFSSVFGKPDSYVLLQKKIDKEVKKQLGKFGIVISG